MFKYLDYYFKTLTKCQLCQLFSSNIICKTCYLELAIINSHCCNKCLKTCAIEQNYCYACLNKQTIFDQVYTNFSYNYPLAGVLRKLKYNHQYQYKWLLGYLLNQTLAKITDVDIIIPMPMFNNKRKYNQVDIMLDYYRLFNNSIPIKTNLAIRIKNTINQPLVRHAQRSVNLEHAFTINTKFMAKKILIIDDIITTGASCNELAKTLKNHGADEVKVCTLMRTL